MARQRLRLLNVVRRSGKVDARAATLTDLTYRGWLNASSGTAHLGRSL